MALIDGRADRAALRGLADTILFRFERELKSIGFDVQQARDVAKRLNDLADALETGTS